MTSSATEPQPLLQRFWFEWALMGVVWLAFIVIGTWFNYHSAAFRGKPISWAYAIRLNVIAYSIWAVVLTPIVLILCRRFPIGRDWRTFPIYLVSMFVTAAVDAAVRTRLQNLECSNCPAWSFPTTFHGYFLSLTESDVWMFWVVVVTSHVLMYYSRFADRELKAVRLQEQLVSTELRMLRMQLHPHFLFNTLHAISAVMYKDVSRADKMITGLGDLLRITLDGTGKEEVPLKRELDFLERYLNIQQARFQDRLIIRLDVQPETLDAGVPYLLLQPVVENAVEHGIAKRSTAGTIEVRTWTEFGNLVISVRNDGPFVSPETLLSDNEGVGLSNTRARLDRLYGHSQEVRLQASPGGGALVEIRIPFKPATVPETPYPVFVQGE